MEFLVRLSDTPRRAYDCVEAHVYGLFRVSFVARFVIVYGLLQGHCVTGLRVSLLDNIVTCLDVNVLACDEFIRENGHYMA